MSKEKNKGFGLVNLSFMGMGDFFSKLCIHMASKIILGNNASNITRVIR